MSNHIYGITGSIRGVPVWAGLVVSDYNITSTHAVTPTIPGEHGGVVTRVYDDLTKTIGVNFVLTSGTGSLPTAGNTFTYKDVEWICTNVVENGKAGEFVSYSVDGIWSEYISNP